MNQSPTLKVLSAMRGRQVRCLLMGGQACVLYGAAEFSRDTDLAILAEPDNLARLRTALGDLQAECIAVPPLEMDYLNRGHAVHFRCRRPDAMGMRVDIMAVMRGVAPFPALWERRTTLQIPGEGELDLMGLPDLVRAKKTQRDKDWLMLRRLMEADYFARRDGASDGAVAFWLQELRTPELLIELAAAQSSPARERAAVRPAVAAAIGGDAGAVTAALAIEEQAEREADRRYWEPLRREIESLRRNLPRE